MNKVLTNIWIKRLLKIIIILILFIVSFNTISKLEIVDENTVATLETVITAQGIIIAIITTFIFSKIFTERNERIGRKRIIDSYSKKLTALRRLAHKLIAHNEFWLNEDPKIIDDKCSGLSVFQFRELDYKTYSEVIKDTGLSEMTIQAYLAAKWLEGPNTGMYEMIDPMYKKNYSLEEIGYYREASIFIYSFLSEYQASIGFNHLPEHWLNGIKEELEKIRESKIQLDVRAIYMTFNDAYEDFLVRLYELTQKNTKNLGSSFEGLFFDLFLASILIILSVFTLAFNFNELTNLVLVYISLSGLLCVIVDIFINTVIMTRKELCVDDFYE
jgi:hypothetical protein